jgi:hypothetical protein
MSEFEDAKDKVMMGAERRTLVMSEEEKKLTAYHEAGHALVALHMPASDPIHKATIIPRGRALGMVMRLPEKDQVSLTRAKCYADLAVAMGGRVAEEEIFGYDKVTSGASGDIQMATKLAKAMATQFGMSDKLGPLLYGENQQEVFLGHSVAQNQSVSEPRNSWSMKRSKPLSSRATRPPRRSRWTTSISSTPSPMVCWSMRPCQAMRSRRCWMASRRCAKTSTIRRRARVGRLCQAPVISPKTRVAMKASAIWSRSQANGPVYQNRRKPRQGCRGFCLQSVKLGHDL